MRQIIHAVIIMFRCGCARKFGRPLPLAGDVRVGSLAARSLGMAGSRVAGRRGLVHRGRSRVASVGGFGVLSYSLRC